VSIPRHTKDALDRYVQHGIPTGGFLYAVLTNNLKESFWRADAENLAAIFDIVSYIYNEIPGACQGSPEKVATWIRTHQEARTRASEAAAAGSE
jgi:hypothetical protein